MAVFYKKEGQQLESGEQFPFSASHLLSGICNPAPWSFGFAIPFNKQLSLRFVIPFNKQLS